MDRLTAIREFLEWCIRKPDAQYAYFRCKVCDSTFWDRQEHRFDCQLLQWREALRSQSLESVRSEARHAALEEAAKCADYYPTYRQEMLQPSGEAAKAAHEIAAAIRALQSPARVAEDEHQFNCQTEGKPCDRWCGANPCLDVHSTELRK